MAVLEKSGIPSKFSNIIRGLMEHAKNRVKNSEGHSDRWFHMSLGLKEGCPAAPIKFSIYHSFIMKDLKSRLLENPDESVRVGFGSEEFNDLPLIRGNPPTKKVRWARTVEQTSKSVNLLLFADDTTNLCRRSNMQNREDLLKQTFKDWKLILNDDKWEHIIAESDPEERKRQRRKMDRTARMLGAHRNALGTFHHEQKKNASLQPGKHSSNCQKNFPHGPFQENWKDRSLQPWWVLPFSLGVKYEDSATKKKENMKLCGLEWYLGSRDRSGEIWNTTGKRWLIFEFPSK